MFIRALKGAFNAYRIRRKGEYIHNISTAHYEAALWRYKGRIYALAPVYMED